MNVFQNSSLSGSPSALLIWLKILHNRLKNWIIHNKHKYAELFAPSLLPLWPSQYWNKSSLWFVPEITNNYILLKYNILMDNLAKANVQLCRSWNLNYERKFPPWDTLTFSLFLSQKITLFKNKYGITLITLISMYHLKPLVSLQV